MNNENNFKETLSVATVPKKRRKKSLFKAQLRMLVILGVLIVALGVGVGVTLHLMNASDGIVDTFTESKTDKTNGKITYKYHSMTSGDSFIITNEAGEKLPSYYVDENGAITDSPDESSTLVYQTAIGSMLQLTSAGKITYYAIVDYNGDYVGGETGCRVLMFPHINQEQVAQIVIHHGNKDGSVTEFTVVGVDSDGDKQSDGFQIKNYESATMNQLLSAAMCSYAGYTLTLKKLSTSVMDKLDDENIDKDSYTPLLDASGNINFAEYGLENTEDAAYYEITTHNGEKYRVYIGNPTPDGTGLYVRYYDEAEGHRNAVYKIADDPGVTMALGVEISRSKLFLGQPEDLVYAQLVYPGSMNTYLMADSFKIEKSDPLAESGFRKVIDFSYVDLALRNYTMDRGKPYIINDSSVLSGYYINDMMVDQVLQRFYEIAGLMSSDYNQTAVNNYVKVKKLVKGVFDGVKLPNSSDYKSYDKYYKDLTAAMVAAIEKAAAEDPEIRDQLKVYGLDDPEYKVFYNSSEYSGSMLYTVAPNYIFVSKLTKNNTYYVWAPLYQQIVEVGRQYLDVLELDSYDWASNDVFELDVNYCDSIRITGMQTVTDENGNTSEEFRDILFELDSSYTISWAINFICSYGVQADISSSRFNLSVEVDENGEKRLTLSSNIKYGVQYKNPETGEITDGSETHSMTYINKVNLNTVKNYCKVMLDSSYQNVLSEEEYAAVAKYSQSIPKNYPPQISGDRSTVKITHRIADSGDKYGFIDESVYVMEFYYDVESDTLTLTAKQDGNIESFVFDEKVFDNYFALKVKNDGNIPNLTEAELTSVNAFYKQINAFNTVQELLRVKTYDKDGKLLSEKLYEYDKNNSESEGSIYMSAFKKFYQTLLYSSYGGYANKTDTVGGAVLTDEEMAAFKAAGDLCDLKIHVKLNLDNIEYVYRMYNYSATKSYITVNGEGIFYILRSRVTKFINDAYRASIGDNTFEGDTTH